MNVGDSMATPSRSARVMLVDDHQTVRQGLRALFQSVPEIEIVHEAADGPAAIAAVRTVAPDLVVIDLSMPKLNGLMVMRQLHYARHHTKIIVLSRYAEAAYVRAAFAAGAWGYVLKQSSFEELRRAIDAALHEQRHLDPALIPPSGDTPPESDDVPLMTEREQEVLRLYAVGHSNKEVGELLEIAVKTVEAHKSSAMKKLGLGNRRQLIRYAALHGWFDAA